MTNGTIACIGLTTFGLSSLGRGLWNHDTELIILATAPLTNTLLIYLTRIKPPTARANTDRDGSPASATDCGPVRSGE